MRPALLTGVSGGPTPLAHTRIPTYEPLLDHLLSSRNRSISMPRTAPFPSFSSAHLKPTWYHPLWHCLWFLSLPFCLSFFFTFLFLSNLTLHFFIHFLTLILMFLFFLVSETVQLYADEKKLGVLFYGNFVYFLWMNKEKRFCKFLFHWHDFY